MKKVIFLVFILFSPLSHSLDNSSYYKVVHVYSWTDGYGHIWLESTGAHECLDQTYKARYLLRPTDPGFNEKFSILLSAKVSGQPVKLKYECENDIPFIKAVRF